MSQRTVARRYATALYEEAADTGVVEAVDEDVLMVRRSMESNGELSRFFESPVISAEKKHTIVQELFEDRVQTLLVQFLRLLIRKDRETMTKTVLDQYQSLRDEHRNIVDATVRVASPLADEERELLSDALEEKTGKSVRLNVEEVPDLIGGLVVRIGDHVFDASLRNQLSSLHRRLRGASLTAGDNGQVNS